MSFLLDQLKFFGVDNMLSYKIKEKLSPFKRWCQISGLVAGVVGSLTLAVVNAQNSMLGDDAPVSAVGVSNRGSYINEQGYRLRDIEESEFNNYADSFVRDWRLADPEYEDTEFGELMYNEASIPTKLEILRLLSKDTPSMLVLLQAISMGVDIEDVLQASVKYEPKKASELASAAVSVLPVFGESASYLYSGYELEDLERDDESAPYRVQEVIDKFFADRLVLRPYPDWFEGQYHFLASAAELKALQGPQKTTKWYRNKSTQALSERPIFVSLYDGSNIVLVDGEDRISKALALDKEALLPVVFVFNRMRERSVDELGYPKTLIGVRDAYLEKSLMLTPVPEWQLGEYHIYAQMDEFYEVFNLPEEDDFEPEAWQKLLAEAENYSVTNASFLIVVLSGGGGADKKGKDAEPASVGSRFKDSAMYAVWDDPRTEAEFKYVSPDGDKSDSLESIAGRGLILNRPDLIAALNALGVTQVPVSFYYIDHTRSKPYIKGSRALINSIQGVIVKPTLPGGGGGFTPCASPPCVEQ